MDGGAWLATVHGVSKSQTQLSDYPYYYYQGSPQELSFGL